MKRLKFSCPFGGKQHPPLVALAAGIFTGFAVMNTNLNVFVKLGFIFGAPVVALIICFLIEQHLTADEKSLIAQADTPIWEHATPELIARIRAEKFTIDKGLLTVMCLCGLFAAYTLMQTGFSEYFLRDAGVAAGIVLVVYAYKRWIASIWSKVDESAVFTEIPVHHMYDVRHSRSSGKGTRRRTRHWYENYIVFYLPDGRYTLHNKSEYHAPVITVVKFRGLIRWMPK